MKQSKQETWVKKKRNKLFSDMQNVFGIGDGILIACLKEQGKDHDATLDKVLQVHRQANLKGSNDKCLSDTPALPSLVK